jgi:hypothetical protein
MVLVSLASQYVGRIPAYILCFLCDRGRLSKTHNMVFWKITVRSARVYTTPPERDSIGRVRCTLKKRSGCDLGHMWFG